MSHSTAQVIEDLEFIRIINLFATWASLIYNKNLNPVAFFIIIQNSRALREELCSVLEINYFEFIQRMCAEYPTICQSKRVINAIRSLNEVKGKTR